jgi:hypothetical protein
VASDDGLVYAQFFGTVQMMKRSPLGCYYLNQSSSESGPPKQYISQLKAALDYPVIAAYQGIMAKNGFLFLVPCIDDQFSMWKGV